MDVQPPKWPERFLEWYCHPDFLEEIQGDAHELFQRQVEQYGAKKARLKYFWNVLRFFRWSNIKKSNKLKINSFVMFKSYIKFGVRNLTRDWVVSTIGILGLAIAIGFATTIAVYVDFQYNLDAFHTKKDRTYQIISHISNEDGDKWGGSPILLGPDFKSKNPSVERQSRIARQWGKVKRGNNVFQERLAFVDPDFLYMFDYPMILGNKSALDQKNNVVISQEMAEKYFGYEDPIGKEITAYFWDDQVQRFVVTGVLEKRPANANIWMDIMVPIQNNFDLFPNAQYDWSHWVDATLIQLMEGEHYDQYADQMKSYAKAQNQSKADFTIDHFSFMKLDRIAIHSWDVQDTIGWNSHPAGRIALLLAAVLLLALACFNYMNIAVSSSTKRLKEIAMRKVMGGIRLNIIQQFLIENMILCFFALVIGIFLSYYLFTPGFDFLFPFTLNFTFSSYQFALTLFIGILIAVALVSGAYPAFYISRFQPVSIFRGSEKLGRKNMFSKVLMTIQVSIACMSVVACFIFTDQSLHLNEKSWGYNPEGIVVLHSMNEQQFKALAKALDENPNCLGYAGSSGHVSHYNKPTNVEYLDKNIRSHYYDVPAHYPQFMGLKLSAGRFFDSLTTKETNQAIINQSFAAKMDWTDPVGKRFVQDSSRLEVIGVVEDFYLRNFYGAPYPAFFKLSNKKDWGRMIVKFPAGQRHESDEFLRKTWMEIAPNDPYPRSFQEDDFDGFYRDNQANTTLMIGVTIISLILSGLGLFGIISFNISSRLKEIGVRKVMGASTATIIRITNMDFIWVVFVAFLLGAPVGFYLMKILFDTIYEIYRPISIWPFILSMLLMILTVLITASGQILRTTKINPADVLRKE